MILRRFSSLLALAAVFALAPQIVRAAGMVSPAAAEDGRVLIDLARKVSSSLARVEFTFKYDRGEAPGNERAGARFAPVIDEERPHEQTGYLIGPALVLTEDLTIHARFIEKIEVRFGDEVVRARPAGYMADQPGMLLELEAPLPGTQPLTFVKREEGPLYRVAYSGGVSWDVIVAPIAAERPIALSTTLERITTESPGELVIDGQGRAVGLNMGRRLDAMQPWTGSPMERRTYSEGEMSNLRSGTAELAGRTLLHVTLNFRSPKGQQGRMGGMRGAGAMDSSTEWNGVGVLLDDGQVLILANLRPSITARLERIRVTDGSARTVNATFLGTLRDHGAFIATLDEPMGGGAKFSTGHILLARDRLLLGAEVRIQGETRELFVQHHRLENFRLGWNRTTYAEFNTQHPVFLFDPAGELITLPMERREKVTVDSGWGWRRGSTHSASDIAKILADGAKAFDLHNIPLSEMEESRVAWLGVEMQSLDRDLARATGVAALTRDGGTGAMVTYIYPDSPADRAGLALGDVLLRLHVQGQPRPLEVSGENENWAFESGFPWEQLDQLPEEYFDQIPTPWAPMENSFIRSLTDLGFGTKFTADVYRDGEVKSFELEIEVSPIHYETAPRYASPPIGVTVRDLTFELRRYFQRDEEDPGVIISNVEPGSKASISGIKPYEMITHINDQPVRTIAEFEKALVGQTDLRIGVRRMTRGRIVRVQLDQPAVAPAATDAPRDE